MLIVYYNPHSKDVHVWPDGLIEQRVRALYEHAQSLAPKESHLIFVGQELFVTVLRVLIKEKVFDSQFIGVYYIDQTGRSWPLHLDSDGRSADFVNWPDINADYLLRLI